MHGKQWPLWPYHQRNKCMHMNIIEASNKANEFQPLVWLELCRHLSHISDLFMILSLIGIMIMLRKPHIIMACHVPICYPMDKHSKIQLCIIYSILCTQIQHVFAKISFIKTKLLQTQQDQNITYIVYTLTDVRSVRTAMSEERTQHALEGPFEASKCCVAD